MRTHLSRIVPVLYGPPPDGYAPSQAGYAPPQGTPANVPAPYPYDPPVYSPIARPLKPIKPFLPLIISTLVAMVLLIVALATPWYGLYIKGSSGDAKAEYSFSDIRYEGKISGSTYTVTTSWSKYTDDYKKSKNKDPALPMIYLVAEILTILAMVMAILAFIVVMLRWLGRGPARLLNGLGLFLLIGAVMGFVAIGAFAGAHTWAMNQDVTSSPTDWGPDHTLIGTHSENNSDTTWTLTTGWFLALVASIIMVIVLVIAKKKLQPAATGTSFQPAQNAPGPYGYYAPPSPQDQQPGPAYPPPGPQMPPGYAPPPYPPQQPGWGEPPVQQTNYPPRQ